MAGARPTDDDPIDPVDPEDPEDPIDPEDPVDPADPEDPLDPEDPADPEDPEDPEDPADPADPEPPVSVRGANVRERAKRAERERDELRERLDRLERGQQQRPDPTVAAEQERRERAAEEEVLLTGDIGKVAKFYSDRASRQSQAQISQVVNHVFDRADKTEFRAMCDESPALKAIAADVEKQLVISRSQGLNPTREALAKYLLGERMLGRAKGAKTRQERTAAQGRERQRAKPGAARSDVNTSGRTKRDSQAERAKRLDESGQL